MINIEVCFLIYQRTHRLSSILKQLKDQTIQSFRVNIWNNSGEKLDISDFPKDRINLVDSKINIGSQARFKLAKQTTGNPIIFFDDDERLKPNFIEYYYNQYLKFGSKCILGWYTKRFDNERYWKNPKPEYGQEVDYIGTGGMVLDREIFDKEPLLQNIPEPFDKTEDLYLCYLARMKYGMKMIKIKRACRILVDGKDQYKKINKEKIFKELRKKGWELLKDKNVKRDKHYWDERYKTGNSGVGSYGQWLDFKIQQIKEIREISSILDVGFGDLNTGLQIASLFPEAFYTGLDISGTALQRAKVKNLDKRFCFKLIKNSVFSYPSDLVLCLDVLFHITQNEDYESILKSLRQSWKKHLFLTAYKDECVNLHTAPHMKIRKFDSLYFSENYEKTLIPLGNENIYLYHFWKDE